MIKFLNNFLSQVAPFLFYLVGGYLVIAGRLDIGTLVAVIAAYKDLPSPMKELIDWDQQRLDVQIKYTQVVEQFTVDDVMPAELQAPVTDAAAAASAGKVRVSNLTLAGEAGTKLIDGVSFEVGLDQHVAILGSHAAGVGELTQMLARLVVPSSGRDRSRRHRHDQGAGSGDRPRHWPTSARRPTSSRSACATTCSTG